MYVRTYVRMYGYIHNIYNNKLIIYIYVAMNYQPAQNYPWKAATLPGKRACNSCCAEGDRPPRRWHSPRSALFAKRNGSVSNTHSHSPCLEKKLPKCCSEKNITVGNGCLLDSMCQNSAVYSLHNQTGTKWPVSGLDLGIRFVEKLCDSDVDTHIIDVHPQKIYMYYILFICTYMWHNIPIILAISNNHGMIAIMNSWLWSPLLFACFCIVYLLLFLLLWLT